ncbi:MAG TPA: prepilin-type N-terminal cleavage/methylation domain-containing protein [Nitrospira sp.]|nr:prepilin-type N-terminal cleavage/methylation domain-containing protein [Nitrospira sp.]
MNRKSPMQNPIRRTSARSRVSGQSGLTLIELMLSLVIGAVVLATTFNIFTVVKTHADKHFTAVRQQQDMRLGLEVFDQEVRLATAESIEVAAPNQILFHANLGAFRTKTTSALLPGQSVIAVQDGSGWSVGKTIVVCSAIVCESHRLARAGQRNQLTLVEPIESTFSAGASVEVRNRVVYYAKRDENGATQFMRMVDGGASVMIGRLQAFQFSYWDEMGKRTSAMSRVKRVVLEIVADQPRRTMLRDVSLQS